MDCVHVEVRKTTAGINFMDTTIVTTLEHRHIQIHIYTDTLRHRYTQTQIHTGTDTYRHRYTQA